MNRLLRDLYYHQAWADAEHWRALEAFPTALEDTTLRGRLHHYHFVQHAFLWLGGAPPGGDFIAWLWKGRPEPDWK